MFHPDEKTLQLFVMGQLNESQEDALEEHLDQCGKCRQRLDVFERKNMELDPFLCEVKAAGNIEVFSEILSGSCIQNQFRLEKKLGSGGMGVVWKAFDKIANRHVVLKFVSNDVYHFTEAMADVRGAFQKVHSLQHTNICPLYALLDDPQYGLYLEMKFIDGVTLNTYLRQSGGLTFAEIIDILGSVACGLDYAHNKKVIHRDIKPQNIMISQTDGVQIIDFGLAEEIRSSFSRPQSERKEWITGTRSYMAPEQWEGWFNLQTDQYALAVTAYELLAGYLPFIAKDTEVLRHCVLDVSPRFISGLPVHVNAALQKGLAKNPDHRFKTCLEFIEALKSPGKVSVAFSSSDKTVSPLVNSVNSQKIDQVIREDRPDRKNSASDDHFVRYNRSSSAVSSETHRSSVLNRASGSASDCGSDSLSAKLSGSEDPDLFNNSDRFYICPPGSEFFHINLFMAIEKNDLEFVSELLQEGVNPNKRFKGTTPLLFAIMNDNVDIADLLIHNGADVNLMDDEGNASPLHALSVIDNGTLVAPLIAQGANIMAKDLIKGKTPLHNAAARNAVHVMIELLKAGTDINAKDVFGKTPLHYARKNGKTEAVDWLIQNGAKDV